MLIRCLERLPLLFSRWTLGHWELIESGVQGGINQNRRSPLLRAHQQIASYPRLGIEPCLQPSQSLCQNGQPGNTCWMNKWVKKWRQVSCGLFFSLGLSWALRMLLTRLLSRFGQELPTNPGPGMLVYALLDTCLQLSLNSLPNRETGPSCTLQPLLPR